MISIVLILVLVIFKGVCEAVKDKLLFHYEESIFSNYDHCYWSPEISWRRKYKKGDPNQGPRFFLSTTVLVFITDGWHFVKWLNNRFTDLIILIVSINFLKSELYQSLLLIIAYNIIKGVIFEKFFSTLLNKN